LINATPFGQASRILQKRHDIECPLILSRKAPALIELVIGRKGLLLSRIAGDAA
jgi:hypothetical protein